jgi:acetyl esterase/lipase
VRGDFHPDLRAARLVPIKLRNPRVGRRFRWLEDRGRALAELRPRHAELIDTGGVRVLVYRPRDGADSGAAILWIHGGGYILGSPFFEGTQCQAFADALGVLVVAVEYRRAPQDPFPAAIDDCWHALMWLASQPDVDPGRLAVLGHSAGGGLAAALAQMSTDRGVPLAGQILVYPMLDDRTAARPKVRRPVRLWSHEANAVGWRAYLGTGPGAEELPMYAAPARRADVSGLPPAWIGVGTLDLFLEEAVAYAEALQAAGVDCELMVVPGAYHAFDMVQPKAAVSGRFAAAQVVAAAAMLGISR